MVAIRKPAVNLRGNHATETAHPNVVDRALFPAISTGMEGNLYSLLAQIARLLAEMISHVAE